MEQNGISTETMVLGIFAVLIFLGIVIWIYKYLEEEAAAAAKLAADKLAADSG